jgi:hypothetical protein
MPPHSFTLHSSTLSPLLYQHTQGRYPLTPHALHTGLSQADASPSTRKLVRRTPRPLSLLACHAFLAIREDRRSSPYFLPCSFEL